MLRRAPGRRAPGEQPAGLDERLIDATLAFLYSRVRAGEAKRLPELAPELVAILERGPGGV